jgi:hypothetical protein
VGEGRGEEEKRRRRERVIFPAIFRGELKDTKVALLLVTVQYVRKQ